MRGDIWAHKIDSSDRSDRYEGVEQAHLLVIPIKYVFGSLPKDLLGLLSDGL